MLTHTRDRASHPARAVVLGSGGFVGSAIVAWLATLGAPHLGLARTDLDLLALDAGDRLAALLRPDDALVVISARAPCKNTAMLEENIRMMRSVCDALARRSVDHVVYISSDAVYADSAAPMTERSCAEPGSLHGVMHLAREIMLRSVVGETPLALLRPTLIYGAKDPHNGYGPNQFRRKAERGEEIVLFGEGEELRDHVLVDDVAELAVRTLLRRSAGILNVATGAVVSFRVIADKVVALHRPGLAVRPTPRKGPMPHNGYRAFDPAAVQAAFPDFSFTQIDEGLKRVRAGTAGSRAC